MGLRSIIDELLADLDALTFGPPATHVYNPLIYARKGHDAYIDRYGKAPREILLLGMNPGPWGMAQTGVPFGTVSLVQDWLGIEGAVDRPTLEHPKRPIRGFAEDREEVSGSRFWGWARDRFGTADRFFERFFVANYCPLVFMESSGRNRTPDKLPAAEKNALFGHCDRALRQIVATLEPECLVGIGKFAEDRARSALGQMEVRIGRILHPSPASPAANRGWVQQAEEQLTALGIDLEAPEA